MQREEVLRRYRHLRAIGTDDHDHSLKLRFVVMTMLVRS